MNGGLQTRKRKVLAGILCLWIFTAAVPVSHADVQNAYAHQSYTEGSYTEAQLHTYGAAVTTSVTAGGSYISIASTVVGVEGGGDPYPMLGSTATIMEAPTPEADTTVSMAWRTRTDIEVDGRNYPSVGQQYPPLAWDALGNLSDIVNLTGVQGPYVLEMTYSESALLFDQPYHTEAHFGEHDAIYLGWFEDEAHITGGALSDQREWVRIDRPVIIRKRRNAYGIRPGQ
jgi:hypothetical protein